MAKHPEDKPPTDPRADSDSTTFLAWAVEHIAEERVSAQAPLYRQLSRLVGDEEECRVLRGLAAQADALASNAAQLLLDFRRKH